MKHTVVTRAFAAALVVWAQQAHAWRETGHWAVCEIAYQNVTDRTRVRIDELMGAEFAQQCTWPDMVRESAEWGFSYKWHFADIDDKADYFSPGTMQKDGDAVRTILVALDMLRMPDTSDDMKRVWVRFLAHVVGDIHQPLHVGRLANLGGTKDSDVSWCNIVTYNYSELVRAEPVTANCEGDRISLDPITGECVESRIKTKNVNLHLVWDFHMIDKFVSQLPAESGDSKYRHKAYARAVTRKVPQSEWQSIVYTLPIDWMNESRIDRATAYSAIAGQALGDAYYERGIAVANERIFYAGVRLANLLNLLFDPTYEQAYPAEMKQREADLRTRIRNANGWTPYERLKQEVLDQEVLDVPVVSVHPEQ